MKILASVYACEPNCGSEPAIGWNILEGLVVDHDLTVITRGNNREVILTSGQDWVNRIDWQFIDLPRCLTWWKKGRRGVPLYYLLWQIFALKRAFKLTRDRSFDLVHHLTFASIVPASPMAFLGLPFIAGPLGGAEVPPKQFIDALPWGRRIIVQSRAVSRWLVGVFSLASVAYSRSSGLLAATSRAAQVLRGYGASSVVEVPQSGLSDEALLELGEIGLNAGSGSEGPLKIMIASRLVFWKGVDIAVDAIAKAKRQGLGMEVIITETGPEESLIREMIEERGLQKEVKLVGRLESHQDVLSLLASQDVLLHPALSESFGQICLEAVAVGIPVVCLDWGGPGMIINEGCGYLVQPGSRDEMVRGMAVSLKQAHLDRGQASGKAGLGRERARDFTWGKIVGKINDVYDQVVEKS